MRTKLRNGVATAVLVLVAFGLSPVEAGEKKYSNLQNLLSNVGVAHGVLGQKAAESKSKSKSKSASSQRLVEALGKSGAAWASTPLLPVTGGLLKGGPNVLRLVVSNLNLGMIDARRNSTQTTAFGYVSNIVGLTSLSHSPDRSQHQLFDPLEALGSAGQFKNGAAADRPAGGAISQNLSRAAGGNSQPNNEIASFVNPKSALVSDCGAANGVSSCNIDTAEGTGSVSGTHVRDDRNRVDYNFSRRSFSGPNYSGTMTTGHTTVRTPGGEISRISVQILETDGGTTRVSQQTYDKDGAATLMHEYYEGDLVRVESKKSKDGAPISGESMARNGENIYRFVDELMGSVNSDGNDSGNQGSESPGDEAGTPQTDPTYYDEDGNRISNDEYDTADSGDDQSGATSGEPDDSEAADGGESDDDETDEAESEDEGSAEGDEGSETASDEDSEESEDSTNCPQDACSAERDVTEEEEQQAEEDHLGWLSNPDPTANSSRSLGEAAALAVIANHRAPSSTPDPNDSDNDDESRVEARIRMTESQGGFDGPVINPKPLM